MRQLLARHVLTVLAALPACMSACGVPEPRSVEKAPVEVRPPNAATRSLWVDATGLEQGKVRLSIGGRAVIDIQGNGRSLAAELSPGSEYAVWINKETDGLSCLLSEGGQQGGREVHGRVAESDVVLTLSCLSSDVRLAELSLHTLDARIEPPFEPDTPSYGLEAYHVNQRAWLSVSPAQAKTALRVRLDGEDLGSAAGTLALGLTERARQLEIELIAPAGNMRTYVVDLSRRSSREVRASLRVAGADASIPVSSMAISDEYLALAAPRAELGFGPVKVFRRTPDGWLLDAELAPRLQGQESCELGCNFGAALATSQDWLAVGAATLEEAPVDGSSPSLGKVFLYQRTPEGWHERARLAPHERRSGDSFGASLALRGGLLAIGNPRVGAAGMVDVYEQKSGDSWAFRETLSGDGGALGSDAFGSKLALTESQLAIAAPDEALKDEHDGARTFGATYVYRREPDGMVRQGKIENPSRSGLHFGDSLALTDNLVALGCPNDVSDEAESATDGRSDGAVYLFRYDGTAWLPQVRLPAPVQPSSAGLTYPARFGVGIAFTADALWVGASDASLDGTAPANGGVLYRYARTSEGFSQTAEPTQLLPSASNAGLGSEVIASPDGVVCVSEPRAAAEVGKLRGRVVLLH